MKSVDDSITLDTSDIGNEPIDARLVCARLHHYATNLRVHESFTSHLGIGDVTISILPRSIRLNIELIDPVVLLELYIPTSTGRNTKIIQKAIDEYVRPYLEDDFYERKKSR